MNIGDYVRQLLFRGIAGKYGEDHVFDDTQYRYGIVTSLNVPEPVQTAMLYREAVEVYFTPTKEHPVSHMPYREYVAVSSLERIA